ncbi:hypothetical protein CAOG_07965 [Capsaspora owczarzaki ATCC 30864]|uniref:Serine aminopeptidase S33 domain-containing protein n=1 Tax=Capsaspora owczarzaki (strain ATCC 30864) TaxID=595528 RepID=A0A0D2USD3_CAPO3|nr:hypothetical protein CAOG_07965 [Capsaspora owczarzaki ATCC 30864]KJE97886.1 hypothetical protein CAOG_007965 [Capsaspora owczarzaki ATCC 30864]|eukprot:XP_004343053.1 hypothetical protein CAOG_07965 [Capsaspora owczarzaki ATCC 30864]
MQVQFQAPAISAEPNAPPIMLRGQLDPPPSTTTTTTTTLGQAQPLHDNATARRLEPSRAVMLVCHGMFCCRDQRLLKDVADAVRRAAGCWTLRFDFSTGMGESDGETRFSMLRRDVAEIRAAISALWREHRLVTIGLVGHSKGANEVLMFAANELPGLIHNPTAADLAGCVHTPFSVVAIAPRCWMEAAMTSRFTPEQLAELQSTGTMPWRVSPLAPEFFRPEDLELRSTRVKARHTITITQEEVDERMATDMQQACRLLGAACRVQFVHGTADTVIPQADSLELHRHAAGSEMVSVQAADHMFSSDSSIETVTSAVAAFCAPSKMGLAPSSPLVVSGL